MEKSKATAVVSFILGLLFWIPLLNIFFGALAVFLGIKSLMKIKKDPKKYGGKWFAVTGILLGLLPIILSMIGLGMCLTGYKDICKNMGIDFLG